MIVQALTGNREGQKRFRPPCFFRIDGKIIENSYRFSCWPIGTRQHSNPNIIEG
jgi:hypothetical protein